MSLSTNPGSFKTDRFDLVNATPGAPGAGNNLVWPVPSGSVIQLIGISATLTTSGAAANRLLNVCVQSSGGKLLPKSPGIIQTDTLAWDYQWAMGLTVLDLSASENLVYCPLSCCYYAKSGESIVLEIVNKDAADALTNIEIRYFNWREA